VIVSLLISTDKLEEGKYYAHGYEFRNFEKGIIAKLPVYSKDNKGIYKVFKKDGSLYKRKVYFSFKSTYFYELEPGFVKAKLAELEINELFK
jgi:hypothetical protein